VAVTAGRAEPDFLSRLGAWAEAHDGVRAVLLTSTRASPAGPVDALSDYDVVLDVADPERFGDFDAWLPGLGPVLLPTPLEERRRRGYAYPSDLDARMTHYLHEIRALPKPG
jgi:hypothetical protein